MTNNRINLKEELKEKLKEIFQFENEALDFGIYRIMNYKRKDIEKFIEEDLIEEINNQLELIGKEEINNLRKEFEEIKKDINNNFGKDAFEDRELKEEFKNTPLGKMYYEKRKQLDEIKVSEDLEKKIYNHLIIFFSRYYDKGDFISKRRYGKKEKYVIPYNGEEVLLYWANKDQYYIKTTEYFRKYTFKFKIISGDITVNFKVVEAEEEKGNIKSQDKKFFVLNDRVPDFDENKKELNIYFEYRAVTKEEAKEHGWGDKNGEGVKQEQINNKTIKILHENILKNTPENSPIRLIFEKEGEKTLIEKHLYRYTRRNTTDYFIHKDLKGFLERELEFYIKNELLNLEDLQVLEQSGYFDKLRLYLIEVRAFRKIALKIIEFLAQIENFQKKIWEKKKFVIETHYAITLDKIKEYAGEEFLERNMEKILDNKDQKKEWKVLFGIDVENKNNLIANSGQLQFNGKKWKKLPVDTKYFDEDFKWNLLVALSENNDLDEILDGVLIKSENFQGLNLLLNKYREKIKTIYIDPPFNSKSTEILYKNDYKHSSWLCLMENRLSLSKQFLNDRGVHVIAIDENEQERLGLLIDLIFGDYQKTMISIVHNPSGIQGENFSYTNEFAYFIYPRKGRIIYPEERSDETADVRQFMNTAKGDTTNYLRESGPNCFYPILVKNGRIIGFGNPLPLGVQPLSSNVLQEDGIVEIYPIDDEGVERKWVFSRQSVEKIKDELFVRYDKKRKKYIIMRSKKLINYKTVWTESKYSAKRYGTLLIKQMGLGNFDFPKSVWTVYETIKATAKQETDSTILDFFAGSGTTAHAVMRLNKEDGGKRKFLLVEMADYFDTVIIPRIKKVAYSFNWKEGKPQDTDGIGVFFKYHTLEQYEDALENIEFEGQDKKQKKFLYELPDYFVKYMLEWETKSSNTLLNLEKLKDPFKYKLKIMEDYQQKEKNVDVIETFNYLLGLHVKGYKFLEDNGRKYIFVFGEKKGKKIAIVWRNMEDIDLEKDKKVIEENINNFNPNKIYINGDGLVNGFESIESLFKSLMFEEVRI